MSKRQDRAYVTSDEQVENARLEHYKKSLKASNIYEEMYWWAAVLHQSSRQPYSDDMSARIVREIMYQLNRRYNVEYFSKHDFDNTLVGASDQTIREVQALDALFSRHSGGYIPTSIADNGEESQLCEIQSDVVVNFLLLLIEIAGKCDTDILRRTLAYFLFKNQLDKFIYLTEEPILDPIKELLVEAYELHKKGEFTKLNFMKDTYWQRQKAVQQIRKLARGVLQNEGTDGE